MEGITIYQLQSNDLPLFIELIRLFHVVFEMEDPTMLDEVHLKGVLAKNVFKVFVVLKGQEVVGGLTVYHIDQYYSVKPLAYIYDLAVMSKFQRQGIGQQLIQYVKEYYAEAGYEEVFVQAESDDEQAVNFYRKTKPSGVEDASHFFYRL